MKKVFLYSILVALCLNLVFKFVCYFQFEKAEGIVTHHELRSTGRTYTANKVRYDEAVAPSIEVNFGNKKYNLCKMEWGFFYKIPLHSKIEVLKYKDEEEFEINSLLYYWITINDLKYFFGFGVLSTLVYMIYIEKKEKRKKLFKIKSFFSAYFFLNLFNNQFSGK